MPELLLEILSEEVPARMQKRAAEDLKRLEGRMPEDDVVGSDESEHVAREPGRRLLGAAPSGALPRLPQRPHRTNQLLSRRQPNRRRIKISPNLCIRNLRRVRAEKAVEDFVCLVGGLGALGKIEYLAFGRTVGQLLNGKGTAFFMATFSFTAEASPRNACQRLLVDTRMR